MHGELGALARGPRNQAEAEQGGGQGRERAAGRPLIQVVEIHATGPGGESHHAHQQQHITHPFGEEGIAGGSHHQGLGVPEAHEQVGGEGEHLQQEVADEQRATDHHAAHGPFEEAHQRVEAGQGELLVQVAQAKELAQQGQGGDQLQGNQVGGGEVEGDGQVQIGHLQPLERQGLGPDLEHLPHGDAAMHKGQQGGQQIQVGRRSRPVALDPTCGPGQGQHHTAESVEGDQPGELQRQGEGRGQAEWNGRPARTGSWRRNLSKKGPGTDQPTGALLRWLAWGRPVVVQNVARWFGFRRARRLAL